MAVPSVSYALLCLGASEKGHRQSPEGVPKDKPVTLRNTMLGKEDKELRKNVPGNVTT